jgi:two-component system, cell cycle response regulator
VRILVAVDDAGLGTWLVSHLRDWRHEAILCGEGLEAWRLLKEDDPPDLAILSRTMPGMDGVAICREMRNIERQAYTYVILFLGSRNDDDVVEALDAGADDFMSQPVDIPELQIRIRSGCRIVRLQQDLLCALSALDFQAARDQLTGLWNRRGILRVLKSESARAVRKGSSVGVIMADLDALHEINSRCGQAEGDAFLQELASEMTRAVRPYDSIGRLGGGKFVFVLPGCNAESARLAAERLRSVLGETAVGRQEGLRDVTMSCGVVAVCGTDNPKAEWMMDRADEALTLAKVRGKNRVEVWQS